MVSTEKYRAPVAFTVGWMSILGMLGKKCRGSSKENETNEMVRLALHNR